MTASLIIAIVLLILLSGLFSCADMVYSVVDQLKLKKSVEKGSKRAKVALKFAENYDETITTILFSNNLVNIAATTLATLLALRVFDPSYGSTLMSIILLISLLISGEILPKVIGRAFSYPLSKFFAPFIAFFKVIFFPFVYVTSKLGILISSPFRKKEKDEHVLTDDELTEMVETIEEEGGLDEDTSELIKSAITFTDTEAHEIMTPRIKMFAMNINDKLNEYLDDENLFKYTRIPVYEKTIDDIVGLVSTKVILRRLLAGNTVNIPSLIEPVDFVPGSMGIAEILKMMKKKKKHIVIIKDEYGGVDGLLTMEDILEDLVGNMVDEFDTVKEDYKKINRSQYEVDGAMNIEDFFELFKLDSEIDGDYTSVGGFVVDKLERFAKVGDHFKYKNLYIEVIKANEYSVNRVFVKIGRKK